MKYAWKHIDSDVEEFIKCFNPTREKVVLSDGLMAVEHRLLAFDSKREAFESMRNKIGQRNTDESVSEDYVLARLEISENGIVGSIDVLDTNPRDMSDCVNCSWGKLKRRKDNYFACDECGYTEYIP